MQLVERHVIKRSNGNYAEVDDLCFKSKNLYNQGNYRIRQAFIFEGRYINYETLDKQLQQEECYKALPAKVAQQVLRTLDKNWKSFFEAMKEYKENPSKFLGCPKLPKYKDKEKGRNLLIYTIQALSKPALRKGLIKPSKTRIAIPTLVNREDIAQVRIVPKLDHYVLEVVYNVKEMSASVKPEMVAAADLGVNNLAAITFNQPGMAPLLINGRPLKSIHQYYNKKKAELQAILGAHKATSRRIQALSTKRNHRVDDYLHKASRYLINVLLERGIGTLVIGQNEGWKQECKIGKQNNQNFVSIPHTRFIEQLQYKAARVGITVIVTEESYTSLASFLDNDPIPKYQPNVKHKFSGRRIERGIYKAKNGSKLNADINGSFNIMRKAVPSMSLTEGVEGVVVRPVRVTPAK